MYICICLRLYIYSSICNTVRPLFIFCKFAINLPVEILFGCNLMTQKDRSNQVCLTVRQYKHAYSITSPETCVCISYIFVCVCVCGKKPKETQHTADGSVISQLSTHWIKLISGADVTRAARPAPPSARWQSNYAVESIKELKNEAVI